MVDGLRSLEDGYIPPIFVENHGAELLDRKVVVRPRESIEWTRRMTEVGLFVGLSSGAIMAGAVKCAKLIPEDQSATIVTIVCDDAGSTCQRAPGATTSTTSSSGRRRSSTSRSLPFSATVGGHASRKKCDVQTTR